MPYTRARQSFAFLGVASLAIVLLGAGCQNPFLRKEPEAVLKRAQERWVNAESVHIDAQVALDIDAPGASGARERGKLSVGMVGTSAGQTPEHSRADIVFTVTIASPQVSGSIILGERVIGQNVYLRLQDIAITPKEGEGGMPSQVELDAMVGAVEGVVGGKWVKIDPKEIRELAQGFGAPVKTDAPSAESFGAFEVRFRQALRAHQLLIARADLGNAKVGRTKAYHYRVGLNRDALVALLEEVGPTLGAQAKDVAAAKVVLQNPELAAKIDGVNAEAWVSKKGNDFVKLLIPIDSREDERALSGSITVNFSDWGAPVTIEAPTDAKSLPELLGPLLGGTLGGGFGGGRSPEPSEGALDGADAPAGALDLPPNVGGPIDIDPAVDADADGLSNADETKYGSNPNVSDTDGDGFTDGEEVEKGYSPTGPGKLTP